MKKIFFTLIAVMALFTVGAQSNQLGGFLFPEFKPGTVFNKDGTVSSGQLNYDGLYQRMTYIQNGTSMYMGNFDNIEKIVIGDLTFIPVKNEMYYEEVTAGNGKFYINHRVVNRDAAANTGFGGAGTGGGMAVETPTVIGLGSGMATMVPAERFGINSAQVETKQEIFLFDGEKYRVFNNANQLSNVYGHKKEISDFAKANKTNFRNKEDLKKIVEYAASL